MKQFTNQIYKLWHCLDVNGICCDIKDEDIIEVYRSTEREVTKDVDLSVDIVGVPPVDRPKK